MTDDQPRDHVLKCWTLSYQAIVDGLKSFEIRKNDRDYHVGDILTLQEWNPGTKYTGRQTKVQVIWILYDGFGLPEGYCIMSIIPIEERSCFNCRNHVESKYDWRNLCAAPAVMERFNKPVDVFLFAQYSKFLKCGSWERILPMQEIAARACRQLRGMVL